MYVIDMNIVFHTLGINFRHNVPVQYKTSPEHNARVMRKATEIRSKKGISKPIQYTVNRT
jgi:hypothetical protein